MFASSSRMGNFLLFANFPSDEQRVSRRVLYEGFCPIQLVVICCIVISSNRYRCEWPSAINGKGLNGREWVLEKFCVLALVPWNDNNTVGGINSADSESSARQLRPFWQSFSTHPHCLTVCLSACWSDQTSVGLCIIIEL